MSTDVGAKLRKLYALATLSASEEKDEARLNEARTAAYLLLKTAKSAGVRLQFVRDVQVPVDAPQRPNEAGVAAGSATASGENMQDENPWVSPVMRRWYARRWGRAGQM